MKGTGGSVGWHVARVAKYTFRALALFIIILGLFSIWWMSSGVFSVNSFDEQIWLAPPTKGAQGRCYRGGMAGDIKNRVMKPGMTRSEVERLLGQPDASLSKPTEYRYVLGLCSGFRVDLDDLHVYFSSDGKLERVAIIQH
jgi:hypothetical protein